MWAPGTVSHLDLDWERPDRVRLFNWLSSFCRLIRFDKRGTGMSDPVSGAPSLETRMDDVRAVMDAAGSRRAAFYGLSEGAAMAIMFAATHPERVAALVVRSCSPRTLWAPDFPWGRTAEAYELEVLVSSTVKDLVAGSGIEFIERGAHELQGIPGEWRLFALARED